MAKLIYAMSTSVDGYTEDEHGSFGWSAPTDEEAHTYICELVSSFRTCLYGRRVYETMVYWETADQVRDQPRFLLEFARKWRPAEKIGMPSAADASCPPGLAQESWRTYIFSASTDQYVRKRRSGVNITQRSQS